MSIATLPQQFRPDSKVRVTVAQCHADLKAEFLDALLHNTPGACLRTPAWADSVAPRRRMSTVAEVVQGLIDNEGSMVLPDLLLILRAAALGNHSHPVRVLARASWETMAKRYADEHADDAAADEEARML